MSNSQLANVRRERRGGLEMTDTESVSTYRAVDTCPSCNSDRFTSAALCGSAFYIDVNGHRFWQPEYEARRCAQCDLVYKSVAADDATLRRYYDVVNFEKWSIEGLFPTEERILTMLKQLDRGCDVLDFGCSTGRLLRRCTDRHRCFGLEINASARTIAEAAGLQMLSEDDLFAPGGGLAFDAILMVDVFEHLSDPTRLVAALAGRLRPGGLLMICTGDSDCPAAQRDLANFWYFRNIEHLVMLNRRHAAYLARETGLELVGWHQVSHYRATLMDCLRQRLQTHVFEIFHRGRSPWLAPILATVPVLRRGRRWTERPGFSTTRDHAIAVFKN